MDPAVQQAIEDAAANAVAAADPVAVQAQIANAVNIAVAAAIAANPPPPGGGAGAPPAAAAAAFSRSPAQAATGLIDYTTSEGMKIYTQATKGLEPQFAFGVNELYMFVKNVGQHVVVSNWTDIMNVPSIPGPGGGQVVVNNLITKYGIVTLAEIKAHALTYEGANDRNAQNSSQMVTFLLASLTDDAKAKVIIDEADYNITLPGAAESIPNGPCLLRVIIRNCSVDTRSTVFHLKESLTSLHLTKYMSGIGYDIELLNQHIKSIGDQLIARGETSSDLLVNLFATYRAVPDHEFVAYINKQKDKYDEGEDVGPKDLMQFAVTRYKDRVREGVWKAKSAEQEQIVALTARLEQLSKKKKLPPAGKEQKKKRKSRDDDPKFAWKLVQPKPGEDNPKVVNGKTYHHGCPHNKWVLHTPEECSLKHKVAAKTNEEEKPKMKLQQAMQTILDAESSDDEDSNCPCEEVIG